MYIMNDEVIQEEVLIKTMQYFEVPNTIIDQASSFLSHKRDWLDKNNILLLKLNTNDLDQDKETDKSEDDDDDDDDEE